MSQRTETSETSAIETVSELSSVLEIARIIRDQFVHPGLTNQMETETIDLGLRFQINYLSRSVCH